MLELKNIKKDYPTGSGVVHALKGVSLQFRDSEFVSILGPSGCGKTTLLNIVGGLDGYTDGDLVINGVSTKDYKDRDWDTYRNHSIGFVFQSYNLISHQSVLQNVELALTLSGVSKAERRARAKAALEQVGLGDQLAKKPSQMSGGQMQRVAIARALVNDPDILLADEPTGALDTETSVQIMEILKEISKDKLIIMVTHNPELAEAYATRIIRVIDGLVTDDSDPYTAPAKAESVAPTELGKKEKKAKKTKKTSMSFFTALSLSLNNLATKKGRTMMTSFAGSIGIIGIALILALSTGINAFIAQVQEDTLSTYPLTIQKNTQDMSAMLSAMTSVSNTDDYRDSGKIYVDDSLGTMMSAMTSTVENNLEAFKKYIDENYDDIKDFVSDIQYTYDYELQVFNTVYKTDENGELLLDKDGNPIPEARKVGMETVFAHMGDAFAGMSELMEMSGGMAMGFDVFSEMINNSEILNQQYDVIAGDWPSEYNEVVLVVNSNNQISKMTLYMLGILDPNDIDTEMKDLMEGNYKPQEMEPYTYEDILGMSFKLLTTSQFFEKTDKTYTVEGSDVKYNVWSDMREGFNFDQDRFVADNGVEIKIAGIIRPKDGAAATSISGAIGYTKALTDYILEENAKSEVINQQKETPGVNVLTGLDFKRTEYTRENIHELIDKIDKATMDMFYDYMTNFIKESEENAALLKVTRANINTMFMLLPEKDQASVLAKMINSAVENNPRGCDAIFATISSMTGGITVTKDNVYTLLPILNNMETMPMITAIGIPGIIGLANAEVVEDVIADINEKHPELEALPMGAVTNKNLGMVISTLPAEEQTEIYKALVDSVNEGNDTMLSILCSILSAQSGMEFNRGNLAETLPTLPPQAAMLSYVACSGVAGFADYASEETMTEVYAEMNDHVMNLEVNDKIFSLLLLAMPDDKFVEMEAQLYSMAPQIDETYESVLETLDDAEKASPASVSFFAKDFESKEAIEKFISNYNDAAEKDGRKEDVLQYTDIVGSLMSSVTIIINAISYVLIACVSISLVVSSIMIGIITNISVLERTKEIGILRAIGASKKDVSRVFNAETLIIGLAAGAIGILSTLLLCIPITAIVQYFTGLDNIRAILPWEGAIVLVIISMALTVIAGIIPSRSAAKKDPVVALRTE